MKSGKHISKTISSKKKEATSKALTIVILRLSASKGKLDYKSLLALKGALERFPIEFGRDGQLLRQPLSVI